MRSIAEVRRLILGTVERVGTETISFRDAAERVLAAPVIARHDVPSFPNSSMDGYAVRAEDVAAAGANLSVLEDLPAGQVSRRSVGPGEAIKIMTGAPMPDGADSVVRVEDTSTEDGKVHIATSVGAGNYVRMSGSDVREGAQIFGAGDLLGPAHIGVLATIGHTDVEVSKRPVVALMSTGDELQPADTGDLGPGMIRDSNRPMLAVLLTAAGAEVNDLGRIHDDADALRAALSRAGAADVIVSSGGVSMGDYDVVKHVLREEAEVEFMQVAMSPGKPLGFGTVSGTPFFGLPGNPVSVYVSFEQFARPALLHMQGAARLLRPRVGGVAAEAIASDPEKEAYIRVRVVDHETLAVRQTGGQGSHVLSGTALADAFAVIPVGTGDVSEGEPVLLELFRAEPARPVTA